MAPLPSAVEPRGGSRVSGHGAHRPGRLQLLVGAYFVFAAALLIVPGLLVADRQLRRRLLEARLASFATTMQGIVSGVEARAIGAEGRVVRFARFLSAEPSTADPALVREFDRIVGKEADGAWRSHRELLDPDHEAGLFLPESLTPDLELKAFFMRAKWLTERLGSGAVDPRLADAWVSPAVGGQVMYVPDQPDFLWEVTANEDYTKTQWMRLAEPAVNPTGVPRWTDPFHSIKTDAWFVSVVAPFTRAGKWAGSVGQDLGWQELVDYSAQVPLETGGHFLIIGRNGGVLVADSTTSHHPSRPDGLVLKDLPDTELRDTLTRLMAPGIIKGDGTPRLTRTSHSHVVYATVARTGWLMVAEIPMDAVNAPVVVPLRTMRLAVLLGLGLLLVASLLTISREIRRRQKNEAAARRAEERFRELFNLSPDGVGVSLLETGLLTEVNDRFVDLVGYERDEILGRTSLELGMWNDPAKRDEILGLIRRDGSCQNIPTVFRHRSGRTIQVEISARVAEVNGRPILLSIVRDVEQQRRLERQLTQAQKMEAIGRLAGGVAHDFNNIMTAVMGYAQIALETLPAQSSAADDLQQIIRASGRASELTRQLLAFARRQVTQPRPVDLTSMVGETRKLLERLLGEDVRLVTDLTVGLPYVLVDPGQIEQVLINLSVNARDAMPKGGALTLRTGRTNGEVTLDVEDTGIGIPTELQAYIFEPFFTTKEHGKGTGLGLATCYGIVRQAGGRIELTSEAGRGARFRVVLPALPEGTLPTHTPSHGTRIDGVIPRGGEVILLAEDEPQVRELAQRLLRGLGYRVMVAEHGDAAFALSVATTDHIDLLVTDVVMPGITGEELATRLKATRPGIKVLYISGYAEDSEAIERALRNGDAFLAKPFSVTDLARQIREVLDRRA